MAKDLKQMTDFLIGLGIDRIGHTDKTYLGHLVALYHMLRQQGLAEDVCRAGLFHSIYGTELFQGFTLPLERRSEVRALIGERAERLAYLNCAMNRPAWDRTVEQPDGPCRVLDRITGQEVELTRTDFDDLCRVHLYDWLEQVPRSQNWDYRRRGYRRTAEWLGAEAVRDYDRVFALETAEAAQV